MMQPQVFISGLILLPGIVGSSLVVKGVAGGPVTLPCTYSAHLGIANTCWGLGDCQSSYCVRTLIWTDGYRVTYQRSSRYQLKGNISEGNMSLTIENAVQSDSGPYCCIVEIPGSFSYVTYSLDVKPEIPTRPTTTERPTTSGRLTTIERPTTTERPTTSRRSTTTGRPTTTERPTITGRPLLTLSTRPTHVPASPRVSTSTPTTPAHMQTHTPEPTTSYPGQTTAEVTETASYTPADWNNTVTSSDDSWNNYTESIPSGMAQNMTKDFYVGISTAALLLLLLLCTAVFTSYILMKKKSGSLRQLSKHGTSKLDFWCESLDLQLF